MEIKSEDYQGKNRRKNGLRLTTSDWIKVVCIIIPLIIGGAVGWTTLGKDVEKIEEKTEELEENHNEDVKGINGKLDTLVNLVQGQTLEFGKFQQKVQTTMEFIQKDIEAIKEK